MPLPEAYEIKSSELARLIRTSDFKALLSALAVYRLSEMEGLVGSEEGRASDQRRGRIKLLKDMQQASFLDGLLSKQK